MSDTAVLTPPSTVTVDLDALERDGFALVRQALSPDETALIRGRIMYAREQGWQDGLNDEGNMWFDSLLDREPETYSRVVGHPAVRPYLEGMLGRQCQLRSMRAHINPGVYRQTWHMDFLGYWHEQRANASCRLAVQPVGLNTTFYFDDNLAGRSGLSFIPGSHRSQPPHTDPFDWNALNTWAEQQPSVDLHPSAGDCVIFYSHIVHHGTKQDVALQRSNIVCHYQGCPMYDGVWHVAAPRGFAGSFPFAPAG
ncbi:MAG: phytanoyl-CoA dioxygenase family protein [Planctomycetes bacterium]|nr:phytanoyl-CoA dioxygenase family protein [Planctomycetota bacterium]